MADLLPADASVEDVLSGQRPGAALCAAGRRPPPSTSAADVFAAVGPRRTSAPPAVDLFTGMLGRIAGDLALATCAWGGVYLCGSVATAWAGNRPISSDSGPNSPARVPCVHAC